MRIEGVVVCGKLFQLLFYTENTVALAPPATCGSTGVVGVAVVAMAEGVAVSCQCQKKVVMLKEKKEIS